MSNTRLQDVRAILQQDDWIGQLERDVTERAAVWERRFDGLGQQLLYVREGMQFVLAKIKALREARSGGRYPPRFGVLKAAREQATQTGVENRNDYGNHHYGQSREGNGQANRKRETARQTGVENRNKYGNHHYGHDRILNLAMVDGMFAWLPF
ncbi:hypothetical protein ACLOJK_019243 [Asimina triloba]